VNGGKNCIKEEEKFFFGFHSAAERTEKKIKKKIGKVENYNVKFESTENKSWKFFFSIFTSISSMIIIIFMVAKMDI
jgi:hypothetical protein